MQRGPAPEPAAATAEESFFGHPGGLSTLFFTEMWERFSYYGMRALLVLYLTAALIDGGMGMTDTKAAAIYGLYVGGVYLSALPGGWIADRLLGLQNAVFWGGVIIALGHFSMAIPSTPTFFLGLLLVVIGTGLLKPNVSAIVGSLYPEGGARRDAGFSIFYMGINLGAFLGPIVCSFLGEKFDWHLGFGAAGVGMVLGLIQYQLGRGRLGDAGTSVSSPDGVRAGVNRLLTGIALVVALVVAMTALHRSGALTMSFERAAVAAAWVIVSVAVIYFVWLMLAGGLDGPERKRVVYIFVLFAGSVLFWAGFEQAGSSMNLFASRLTDRGVLGWEIPAGWLQSVNSTFIILLAPVFGVLWIRLARRDREPSLPVKFGLGLILLGIGFFVLAWGSSFASETTLVSPMWLVVTYFFHTCGELCLSPVGLSSVTKLSPTRLVGQMMGIWFMGTSLGNLLAGLAAGQFDSMPLVRLFGTVAAVVVGAGLVFLVFNRPIDALAPGVVKGTSAEVEGEKG